MLGCLALVPQFSIRFYLLIVLLCLGIPWSHVDFIFSSFDVVKSQAPNPPRRPIQVKNIARSQRRSYQLHTKFKPAQRTVRQEDRNLFGGWALLLPCLPNPPVVSVMRAQVFDIMWAEAYWDRLLGEFLATQDPRKIMEVYQIFESTRANEGVVTVPINKQTFISSLEDPYCLSGRSVQTGIIIDSGASVCITPHRSDFINYKDSQMKIRNLLSSNNVAGEGIIRWSMQDEQGEQVSIELLGYHIPTADVRLLSPQVLLKTIGGYSKQTVHGVQVSLDNGIKLSAAFCPRSNLPIIPLAHEASSKQCFWTKAFGFSADSFQDLNLIRNVLHQTNTNLSQSQKELLLWHQRLSHASVKWIQALMRDQKWLPSNVSKNEPALHSGPFI